jgi:trehalose 6-phosphate phosphatase
VPESSRRPDRSLPRALELARSALANEPAGLLTDFDGTLSPIVANPFDARLADGAHAALQALTAKLAVVAIVTGREPREARDLVGVPGVLVAGNHGTEWLEPGAEVTAPPPGAADVRRALDEALARITPDPALVVEHKGSSAAVHFRAAPDPDATRASIVAALGDVEPLGLRVSFGRMVVELRAPALGDKGSGARRIVERFGLRGAVIMGDDTTDVDMFRAVADLRDGHGLRAAIIAVGGSDHEAPPEVAAAADALLLHPAEAAAFLAALAEVS